MRILTLLNIDCTAVQLWILIRRTNLVMLRFFLYWKGQKEHMDYGEIVSSEFIADKCQMVLKVFWLLSGFCVFYFQLFFSWFLTFWFIFINFHLLVIRLMGALSSNILCWEAAILNTNAVYNSILFCYCYYAVIMLANGWT
jgi:uncharacterized membrane protein